MLKIPEKIQYVIKTLESKGFEAYIVGGCVRDYLLGKVPHDFDVTTSAKPDDIRRIFERTVPTGIKHGTVTVIAENEPVEVTTFRTEGQYTDCRRPDKVEFVTDLKSDLERRDFTVNAMAFNNTVGLVDCFGGGYDLEKGILRAVGDPEKRFSEDALRILRLFRFSSQLGFSIEKDTLNAAVKLQKGLEKISRERIFTELFKGASGENLKAFAPLIKSGGLEFLNIKNTPDFDVVKKCRQNSNLAFFSFIYLSGADVIAVLDELKTSNSLKNYCKALLKLLSMPKPENKAEIKEMLNISGVSVFEDFLTFLSAKGEDTEKINKLLKEITENNEPYRIADLKISGKELINMGFKGNEVGDTLEKLRKLVIENPEKNNKSDLMRNSELKFPS